MYWHRESGHFRSLKMLAGRQRKCPSSAKWKFLLHLGALPPADPKELNKQQILLTQHIHNVFRALLHKLVAEDGDALASCGIAKNLRSLRCRRKPVCVHAPSTTIGTCTITNAFHQWLVKDEVSLEGEEPKDPDPQKTNLLEWRSTAGAPMVRLQVARPPSVEDLEKQNCCGERSNRVS